MYNNEFEIVFFNDFLRRWRRDLILDTYPKFLNNTGGALWLRKRAPQDVKLNRWIHEVSPDFSKVTPPSMSESPAEEEISKQLQ